MTATAETEDTYFRAGIAALQGARAAEARDQFQAAIDAGLATANSWLGLALASLVLEDNRTAETAVDEVLSQEPRHLRGLIIKGDLLLGRDERRAALSYYNLVMQLAATLADIPAQLRQDLTRIQDRMVQISAQFQSDLMECLGAGGYRRETASARFNLGLDMLLGKVEREHDPRPFPQKPHAFYLPDMPYQPFYPVDTLPWVSQLESATEAINQELNHFLSGQPGEFVPYVHGGLELPGQTPGSMKDPDSWTAAFVWRDGMAQEDVMSEHPTLCSLMESIPLTEVGGFSPSVLFSRLRPGARIDPHTGLLNCRLICHLPLVVPSGCGLRVGEERREVARGRVWAFDDSISHEAWNESDADRVVLIFDIWHPDLDKQERRDIKSLLEAVSGQA